MNGVVFGGFRRVCSVAVLVMTVPLTAVSGETPHTGHDLAELLCDEGWEIAAGTRVRLPASELASDGPLTADLLEAFAGRRGWKRFADASRMAPIGVTIVPQENESQRVGHLVTTRFALHTPLDVLEDDEHVQRAVGLDAGADGASFRQLTLEEPAAAGVVPAADGREQFGFLQVMLLNRIELQGVVCVQRQQLQAGIVLAWAFDHRFDDVPQLRATSSRLEVNELGERVAGPAIPYEGAAGMVTARQLSADESSALGDMTATGPVVIVESILVVAEPAAWFGGSNLLRAKIPLITQEGVRDLRRRLEAAESTR